MNGFSKDDEPVSHYKSSPISQDYDTRSSSSFTSDRSSKQPVNPKTAQPNMLSDLAAIVRSTSKDGEGMPGYRTRQKASST
jgi:hypothetical protein